MVTLKPHVRLVCPVCGVTLGTMVWDASEHAASWVLNETSQKHLDSHA